MTDLSALKAIADAATEGPWEQDGREGLTHRVFAHSRMLATDVDIAECGWGVEADARFIATFDPPTVKALLAVVEAAEDLLDVFNGEADDLASCSYFRGEGACGFGCRDEPSCMTDIPEGGWPSSRLSAALAALHDTEGR